MIDDLLTQLKGRDPSVCLAVAALLKSGDEHGATQFGATAVAYREDYLDALRRAVGEAGPTDPGTLSVDDVRSHLATSLFYQISGLAPLAHSPELESFWIDLEELPTLPIAPLLHQSLSLLNK